MNRMLERMNHVLLAVAVLAVLSLTSCEHKDLCHDSLHVVNVKVVFDWRNAPGATPETMRLYLFPVRGGKPQAYGEVTSACLPVVTGACASTPTRSPCFTGVLIRSRLSGPTLPTAS